jgi:putative ABC transport system permease protein
MRVVPISLNRNFLRRQGLKLGDELTWDVQGLPLVTRVSSVRTTDNAPFAQPFAILFPAGTLEGAPKRFAAKLYVATSTDSRRVQQSLATALPKVIMFDLMEITQILDRVFEKLAFVIEFLTLFIVATGVIMLAAAVLSGRSQRIRETVLLRTLGATGRQLSQIQVVEYVILGVLSGLLGVALALIANELLARYAFKIPSEVPASLLLITFASVIVVTLGTGWFSNRGIAFQPPLEVLRQET